MSSSSPAAPSGERPLNPAPVAPATPAAKPEETVVSKLSSFRRAQLYCMLPLYAIWCLPGFINIISVMGLAKRKGATVRGYTKYIHFYPLIPITLLCCLLVYLGVPVFPVAVVWAISQWHAEIVATEDVKRSSALGLLGFMVAFVAIYISLWIAGVDINGFFSRYFGWFTPTLAIGTFLLLTSFRVYTMVVLFLRASFKSSIRIDGNQYETIELGQETPYSIAAFRLRARVEDWYELLWTGSVELVMLPSASFNLGARTITSGGATSMEDERANFRLRNVPGGYWVDRLISHAMAVWDTE